MPRPLPALALACTLASAAAGEEALPGPGAYEVAVRLELPHLADATATRALRLCLAEGEAPARVLSDNNPLARCPATNRVREGGVLTFDVACPGRNAATGTARFALAPGLARGRIDMRMGGKNMTMTESQVWRRSGPCDVPSP